MSSGESIALSREIEVIQIPSGQKLILPAGTSVTITQGLGGSYTVTVPTQPGLYRISGQDADALGKEKVSASTPVASGAVKEEDIWEQLKSCYDPEIPVNIVDLGLIYSLELNPGDKGIQVNVKMTLTAQGCGMGPAIAADAREKILTLPGIVEAQVEVVWEPAWNPSMISPEGKKRLGMS